MLIYKITNEINDKVYIGQTTQTLNERKHNYKNELYRTGNLRPIIAAMKKYGFEKFHFEILEDNITSREILDEREIYYINYFHSLTHENGYNLENGGNSVGKHSEETKYKISRAQIGNLNHMYGKVGKLNATSKPVLELTTGQSYESAMLAAKALNINFSHICACARGIRGSTGGYVFRYLDQNNNPIQPEQVALIKSISIRNNVLPQYKYLLSSRYRAKS